MVFRTVKAPAGFPDFDTYSKVVSAFELEPAGDGRTRVRLTGTGYEDSEAGRRLLGFFEKGNQVSLDALKARFAKSASPPPLRAGLEPLRFLLGHCWRGEFKDGAVDTHCFESVYGGRHIRDRHEVTGTRRPLSRRDALQLERRGEAGRLYLLELVGRGQPRLDGAEGRMRSTSATRPIPAPDGRKMTISTMWRKAGADAYEAVSTGGADPTGSRVVRYTRVD